MEIEKIITNIEQNMPAPYQKYKALVTPSEVPLEFHPFVFLTMISAIIGDKVYFIEGTDKIYPNLWTLLIGESSVSRKSSAIRPALSTLEKMDSIKLLSSRGSPEGIFEEIVKNDGVGLLSHSELGSLLGGLKKDYMRGLTEDFCEYYDPLGAKLKKKLISKDSFIAHLAISWIACTTQTSLSQHVTASDDRIASGFLPRFNIVFGTTITDDLVPFRPPKEQAKQDTLLKKLTDLSIRLGKSPVEFTFSQEAVQVFSTWYNDKRREMTDNPPDGVVGYFWTRALEVAKKYAAIFAILKGKPNIIDKASMKQAILIGEYFLASSQRLIEREIPASCDDRIMQQIFKVVEKFTKKKGCAEYRDIIAYTHTTKKKLEPYLDTLKEQGLIDDTTEVTGLVSKRVFKIC